MTSKDNRRAADPAASSWSARHQRSLELTLKRVIMLIALIWTLIITVLWIMDHWVFGTNWAAEKIVSVHSTGFAHLSAFGIIGLIGLAGLWLARLRLLKALSERDQAEKALRESDQSYRDQFIHNSTIMLLIAPDDGMIIEANVAALRFYGYSQEQLLTFRINDISIFPTAEARQVITSVPHDQGKRFICQHRLADGSTRDMEVSSSIVQFGERILLHAIIYDITTRQQIEANFREVNHILKEAMEQAKTANIAKSAFLTNMSHEIRTPMNAILGFAQLLECESTLTPKQIGYVQTITQSGKHLLELINDILDLSKIEAGRVTLNLTDFCLPELINDLAQMFLPRAHAKGLQLMVDRNDSVPFGVTADEGKLRQIFVNLIGNAIKFTETGGVAIRVRAEAILEPAIDHLETLRLVVDVEDTGPGIPAEELNMLFGAFQQGAAGVKHGGTGLGLAISRRLLSMMGGTLTLTSQAGKGCCFRFEALMKPADLVTQRQKPVTRRVVGLEPGSGLFRILVVDDTATNRTLMVKLLRPVGFDVHEASNGIEALAIFKQWSPHAVLMDLRMPVMDGYEATRRIKATKTGRATPVIGVTANVFEQSKNRIMDTGVDTYICKPFRPEELFEVLKKVLGLRYLFANESTGPIVHQPLTAEALAALPNALIQAMRQAVAAGDMGRLTTLIGDVAKVNLAVASGLQALASRYDYDQLNEWLQQGKGEHD